MVQWLDESSAALRRATPELNGAPSTVLDVFLRGARDYVQGTQIIARVADAIGDERAVLSRAAFSSITRRKIMARARHELAEDETVVGHVAFDVGGVECERVIVESREPAPRRDVGMDLSIEMIRQTSRLSAAYAYRRAGDFEALLNVVVQGTKCLHDALDQSVRDIWFTGIRGFPLPVGRGLQPQAGFVDITCLRVMRRECQYQSLLRVAVADPEGSPVCAGHVTFAFKAAETIDVD